jgi:drug/metabolite transporter (DMT)-like permease
MIRPETKLQKGILCISGAATCAAILGAYVKYASSTISTEMMVFGRMLLSFLMIIVWIEISRPTSWKEKLKTREWKIQLARGLAGLVSIFLYFYALKYLSLANAMLLFNTMPLFVPIVAYFWKRIPIPHKIFWGIGIAFLGIIVILKPTTGVFETWMLLGLLAGVTGAIATVALRFSHYTEPGDRTLFYYFLSGVIVSGLISLKNLEENWMTWDAQKVYFLLIVGVIGFVYQVLFTLAARYAPVRMISSFLYGSVVLGMVLDWWIWGTLITPWTFIGFALVVFGAFLNVFLYPKDPITK